MNSIQIHSTNPLPLGARRLSPSRYRFSLYASEATEVVLVLVNTQTYEITLSPTEHRTGAIWHAEVEGISEEWSYAFRVHNPLNGKFESYLSDPYGKNIHSPQTFGATKTFGDYALCYLREESFDWEDDCPLNLPAHSLVLYELHVRSFTKDPSSKTTYPGSFLGIIEKIDYLKQLGINAIQLMPIFEFDETAHPFKTVDKPHLCNYWGYASVNFFSPCRRYAYASDPCAPQREFKTLVKALHQAGIEIILDVVFNHTGIEGTTCPLPWIDRDAYYILDHGQFTNYSGCGNTVQTNHPMTARWIVDVLRYWVEEMHVDGFRFDLASIFCRDSQGCFLPNAPVLQSICSDPVLLQTKLIAEPWDAGGFYQLGYFPTFSRRWSEWNGAYRDQVKAFLNGDPHQLGNFASRLAGSQDIYPKGKPINSINYICSHDGMTLRDTVSYNEKHNEENGENNCDGTNANYSYNFGVEGESLDPNICTLRERQMRSLILTLFLSKGIPMLQSGDEYGHTAQGNNNRWALDTTHNYFLWDQLQDSCLFEFTRQAIRLRRLLEHTQNHFFSEEDITWLDVAGQPQNWTPSTFLACTIPLSTTNLYFAFHAGSQSITVTLPKGALYEKIADSVEGFISKPLANLVVIEPHSVLVAKSIS